MDLISNRHRGAEEIVGDGFKMLEHMMFYSKSFVNDSEYCRTAITLDKK